MQNPQFNQPVPKKHEDVALAWLRDETTAAEAGKKLVGNSRSISVYIKLARALRSAFRKGRLEDMQV